MGVTAPRHVSSCWRSHEFGSNLSSAIPDPDSNRGTGRPDGRELVARVRGQREVAGRFRGRRRSRLGGPHRSGGQPPRRDRCPVRHRRDREAPRASRREISRREAFHRLAQAVRDSPHVRRRHRWRTGSHARAGCLAGHAARQARLLREAADAHALRGPPDAACREEIQGRHADGESVPVARGLSHRRQAGPRRCDRQGEGSAFLAERQDGLAPPQRSTGGRGPGPCQGPLGQVARRCARPAVQGADLSSVQLAGLAGLQQRPARRLRLSHPRSGLPGSGVDRAGHRASRSASGQP